MLQLTQVQDGVLILTILIHLCNREIQTQLSLFTAFQQLLFNLRKIIFRHTIHLGGQRYLNKANQRKSSHS